MMWTTVKKVLSLPLYGSGLTIGALGLCIVLPGGLLMLGALGVFWVADRLTVPRYWRG